MSNTQPLKIDDWADDPAGRLGHALYKPTGTVYSLGVGEHTALMDLLAETSPPFPPKFSAVAVAPTPKPTDPPADLAFIAEEDGESVPIGSTPVKSPTPTPSVATAPPTVPNL